VELGPFEKITFFPPDPLIPHPSYDKRRESLTPLNRLVVASPLVMPPPPDRLRLCLSSSRRLSSRRTGCNAGNDKKQGCESGDDEKNLVVIWLQMALTCKVAAVVVARIERKPEGLGTRDEL
jgi:hypothetical protein